MKTTSPTIYVIETSEIGADKQTIIFNVTLLNLNYKFACEFASMLHQHINGALKIARALFLHMVLLFKRLNAIT